MSKYYFTSESVTEGHPDKLCDYISDTLLDEYLKQDPDSRVAIETFAAKDEISIAGQVTSKAKINEEEIEKTTRNLIKEIGYDNSKKDIDYKTCKIRINITKQSSDIAMGVDLGGAGDQGIMFGYATNETKNYMPYPINLAHKLAKRLTKVRKEEIIKGLRPDGKTQVTIEYENDIPKRIETILISTQHEQNVEIENLKKEIIEKVINKTVEKNMIDENTKIYINPTGKFEIGGPLGDTRINRKKNNSRHIWRYGKTPEEELFQEKIQVK